MTTPSRFDPQSTLQLPPDPHGPRLPLVLGGRYRLSARLGGGGMANVYRAIDTHLDRNVAVKLMTPKLRADPEFDARFRREAQIVSKLNDPQIVVVHDFGLDAEHGPYLVMELLEGETLRERLNAKGALPLPAALQLGEQLMLALAHAHGMGVIHRDLKPDNVFLLAQSGVKLHVRVLDFGISQMIQVGRGPHEAEATQPGSAVGTPRYMAPEQLAGKGSSERSDLYAAALVIYEALIGHLPDVTGPRLRELRPDAPDELVHVIEQCLSQDPDDRPVTAAEAYLHLHELVRETGSDLLISDTAKAQLTARFRKSALETPAIANPNRRYWLIAGLAFTLMVGPVIWALQSRKHPRVDRDSLAGITIGSSRDDVVARLGKPIRVTDPASVLRPFVQPAAFARVDESRPLEVLSWPGPGVVVALAGTEVRAVIARGSGAATGRDLRVGDEDTVWRRAYPEAPSSTEIVAQTAGTPDWGQIYRYDESGLIVEIRQGRVAALALIGK